MIEEFTGSKTKDFEKGGRYWTSDELCHQGAQQADAALQVPSDERVVKYLKDLPSTEDEEESMDDEGKPGLPWKTGETGKITKKMISLQGKPREFRGSRCENCAYMLHLDG